MDYRDIITHDPEELSCAYRIKGLQVSVQDVLDRLVSGMPEAAILAEIPDLTSEHIRACIAFVRNRITSVLEITSENPSAEVWKYLRFLLDRSSTAQTIRAIHDIPVNVQTKNINKQAEQIGFCLRQAEQYFIASTQVGLATRPVLLYYGAVSLSQALILLKMDGTYSLDARRREPRHNHHGLELGRGIAESAAHATNPRAFLEKVECFCHCRESHPWGHFGLFYRSLVPSATTIHTEIYVTGKRSLLEQEYSTNAPELLSLDSIATRRFNAWEIFKGLPDLYFSLRELGVASNLCRGNVKRRIVHSVSPKPLNQGDGDPTPSSRQDAASYRVEYQDSFFLDAILPEQKEAFIKFYSRKNPRLKIVDDYGPNMHLSLTVEGKDEQAINRQMGYYPDITEDLTGRKYYIINPDNYLPEPAAILALLFCFSMLCRYYPDVWMRNIDGNVRFAELMNVFLNTAYRKFPNLILDQLTLTKHNVHI
jgi:uncharacterized protein (DUF433 family)